MTDARDRARRRLLADLDRPVEAPDLAPAIMSRLGYAAASPVVARRGRRRRLARRAAATAAVLGLTLVGMLLHDGSPRARSRVAVTVPEALGADLGRTQEQMRGTFRAIRSLIPAAPPVEPIPADADRSGMGPIDDPSWRGIDEPAPVA